MGVDRRAILQNAQSLASRGQYDAAIAEWKKLLSKSASDAPVHNSIGDLQLKRNAPKDAIAAYLEAGKAFRSQGETLKAIAAYKKILKVDPSRTEIYRNLGDLNAERGLTSSAVADYSTLARLYLKERKTKDALEVYRVILTKDPSNMNVRKQIVELCVRENVSPDPYLNSPTSKSSGASTPAPSSEPKDSPADGSLQGQITKAVKLMESRDYDGADSILTQLLNQEPGNPEVCQALARLHLRRGELDYAQGEYEFLAGAALRADDLDLAESLLKEFLEVQPSCAPISEMVGMVYEKRGDPETAALNYGKALQALLEHPDPDQPSLPEELYEKIKELAPESFLVGQFAPAFEEQPPVEEERVSEPEPAEPDVEEAPVSMAVEEPQEREEPSPAPPAPSEKPQKQDNPEVHFVLGRAYRDMGLLNEAIEELRFSVTATEYFLDSCLELAICLRERGMGRRAISCLEHAMNDPRCAGEKAVPFRYELGLVYEAEGLLDRALRTFEGVASFQDAAKHIEWIKGGGQKERAASVAAGTPVGAGKIVTNQSTRDGKKRRISYL